jgi:hypothetical protein
VIFWYVVVGLWTWLALCWSVVFLSGDGAKPSKAERLVRAAEDVGTAYKNSQR